MRVEMRLATKAGLKGPIFRMQLDDRTALQSIKLKAKELAQENKLATWDNVAIRIWDVTIDPTQPKEAMKDGFEEVAEVKETSLPENPPLDSLKSSSHGSSGAKPKK